MTRYIISFIIASHVSLVEAKTRLGLDKCHFAVPTTDSVTVATCKSMCERDDMEFPFICDYVNYSIENERVVVEKKDGCYDTWIHGYNEDAQFGRQGMDFGTQDSAAQCQERCGGTSGCVRFGWNAFNKACFGKKKEHIAEASATLLPGGLYPVDSTDDRWEYCNMNLDYSCNEQNSFVCKECEGVNTCVYESHHHIAGPGYCIAPFAPQDEVCVKSTTTEAPTEPTTTTEEPTEPTITKDGSLTKTAEIEKDGSLTKTAEIEKDGSLTKTAEIEKDGSLTKTAEIEKDGSLTKTAEIEKDGSLTKTAEIEKDGSLTKTAEIEKDGSLTKTAEIEKDGSLTKTAVRAAAPLEAAVAPVSVWAPCPSCLP